jgi:class 3 adenylate cyclase
MAVFGAPVALEDHAVRACRATLGVQEKAERLAAEVRERDGVDPTGLTVRPEGPNRSRRQSLVCDRGADAGTHLSRRVQHGRELW